MNRALLLLSLPTVELTSVVFQPQCNRLCRVRIWQDRSAQFLQQLPGLFLLNFSAFLNDLCQNISRAVFVTHIDVSFGQIQLSRRRILLVKKIEVFFGGCCDFG